MATNMGRKTYISPTPQPDEMKLTDFEALLDWVEIKFVGNIDQTGTETNIINYDTMDTKFSDKGKGISNAGDPTVECRYDGTDAGQLLATQLALTPNKYAVKFEYDDAVTPSTGTGTIEYNRGIVTGPLNPNGGPEDFKLSVFTFGFVQQSFTVPAT